MSEGRLSSISGADTAPSKSLPSHPIFARGMHASLASMHRYVEACGHAYIVAKSRKTEVILDGHSSCIEPITLPIYIKHKKGGIKNIVCL